MWLQWLLTDSAELDDKEADEGADEAPLYCRTDPGATRSTALGTPRSPSVTLLL